MAFEPGIPSAANNPLVSVSSLPEGTLFIVVGSILLGLIVIVLCWRLYAIWAAHRAARNNEARFTALEPSYGGPFVDPVDHRQSYIAETETLSEKPGPELHPVGVPLNSGHRPAERRKSHVDRPKSQVERMRDAQLKGKFFSPTADLLQHGSALAPSVLGGSSSGPAPNSSLAPHLYSMTSGSRLSVMHSGRNSMMQQSSLSMADFGGVDSLPGSSNPSVGHSRVASMTGPIGPMEGSSNPPRTKKLRPPSTYLDGLG